MTKPIRFCRVHLLISLGLSSYSNLTLTTLCRFVIATLLDGGFSSQVKNYVEEKEITDSPLWSSHLLFSKPDAVIKTHCDYIKAGCDIITTNSYQASVEGFQKNFSLDHKTSLGLIEKSVSLARKAIQDCAPERKVLVAGSVGPYGACLCDGSEYRGDYITQVTKDQLIAWHRPRIASLVHAGVDLLAVETIPAAAEAAAVLQLLADEFPQTKAWVSFSCKDEKHISDGTELREALQQCCQQNRSQLIAVGVNCLAPALVSPLLSSAQDCDVPFIVYPNSGENWQRGVGWTNKAACLPLTEFIPQWLGLGARYIGGCCRTDADDIKHCRQLLDSIH